MMPFVPKRTVKLIPCEIDGISIGVIKSIESKFLNFIWVLCRENAKTKPILTEIIVVIVEIESEFFNAVKNKGEFKMFWKSSSVILNTIFIKG